MTLSLMAYQSATDAVDSKRNSSRDMRALTVVSIQAISRNQSK